MQKRFYVTTAIDYANGSPHLGHAYEKVLTDVVTRVRRLQGAETHFLMAGQGLLFVSALLFGLNLYWAIGCPLLTCCPKAMEKDDSANQKTEGKKSVENKLSEEEAGLKASKLTFVTFVVTAILVIAFAGVVFSLIL